MTPIPGVSMYAVAKPSYMPTVRYFSDIAPKCLFLWQVDNRGERSKIMSLRASESVSKVSEKPYGLDTICDMAQVVVENELIVGCAASEKEEPLL
jgi:hypothetical protein